MIRPVRFGYNAETAVNNAFQNQTIQDGVQEKALYEFDNFVAILRQNDIDVLVVEDTLEPHTPDSIFPNNWITFHEDNSIVLYPMFATNRRLERKHHVIEKLKAEYVIANELDLSIHENENIFLEGTGSIIFDREKKKAYACLSPRTDKVLFEKLCNAKGYTPVVFNAKDANGQDIYHTNVMMCVGDKYCVICMDSIADKEENDMVKSILQSDGKAIIDISLEQMNKFAGNMLQVKNKNGEHFLVMSEQAYNSLTTAQIEQITQFNSIIHAPIYTIETNGGGSARCMMAEIVLDKKY